MSTILIEGVSGPAGSLPGTRALGPRHAVALLDVAGLVVAGVVVVAAMGWSVAVALAVVAAVAVCGRSRIALPVLLSTAVAATGAAINGRALDPWWLPAWSVSASVALVGAAGLRAVLLRRTPRPETVLLVPPGTLRNALTSQFRAEVEASGPSRRSVATVVDDAALVGEAVREHGAAAVIVAPGALAGEALRTLEVALAASGTTLELATGLCDVEAARLHPSLAGRVPTVILGTVRQTRAPRLAKRSIDVAAAGAALLIGSPLLLLLGLAVKLDTPGPVLFRQTRVGKGGAHFTMLKFRTMVVDAETQLPALAPAGANGALFKLRDDPRVTRVGRLLRALSLDELPQLLNVVRGDMSLVGPRPALPAETLLWPSDLWRRVEVLPGLTGLWQISGRSDCTFDDYRRWDLHYVDNWTVSGDLRILARTIPTVLARNGAY